MPSRGRRPIASRTIDRAIFDPALLEAVQRMIPPERLHAYLRDLDGLFLAVVESPAGSPGMESQAHKIVSQAGMLGLTRMSQCARAVEDACRSGAEPDAALRDCRAAVGDIRLYAMPVAGAAA